MIKDFCSITGLYVLTGYALQSHETFGQLFCLIIAWLLWHIAKEDYQTRLVDLRALLALFLTGIAARPDMAETSILTGIIWTLVPLTIHEARALHVPKMQGGDEGFLFNGKASADGNGAPPYLPALISGLAGAMLIYLLNLPLPWPKGGLLSEPMSKGLELLPIWIPLAFITFFFLLWFFFHKRNQRAKKKGLAIIYRGMGDGDIYAIGAISGVFGMPLITGALFLSLFPACYLLHKAKRGGFNA